METTMEFTREIQDGLAAPFSEDEIEFLPRAQSGGKALGLAYIDARAVMNRLDAVVGPAGWSFDFEPVTPDGKMVKGRLTVLGVTKCDAGEASTEDEILKSAVSDALKRCAVHFGIGRYLYYLPRVWAPYDAQKRRFTETPRLERSAVEHALRVCGVAAGSRSEARPALRVERAPEPAPAPRAAEPEKKSIWAAGSGKAQNGPESSGDRAASRAPRPAPAAESAPASLVCSTDGCGKALTRGQHDISVRTFGQPFCPACQKAQQRAA